MDQREFNARLDRKYDILAEEAAAKTLAARTDASSLPQYRADLGFQARASGQHSLEGAATEAATRFMNPDWLRGAYRQLVETGQLPANLPTAGAGAPGAGAPGTVQFQTLPGQPGQPGRPAVSPTSADATFQPTSILTSPTSIEDMSPEQLAQETASQAAQGVQTATGSALPSGPAAQRRLAAATARLPALPSLTRPTSVTTSKVSATSPLYSTGFKRGTANVKRQGLKKGTPDVKPDEDTLGALPRPMLGVAAAPGAAVPGAAAPGAAPGFIPSPSPAGLPSPSPAELPSPTPAALPPAGGFITGPAGPQPGQPVGPGYGTPWDPNAGYGKENLGGIVDATLRMVNPEKFNEALKSFRPSENIEDRRGETYTPGPMLGGKGGVELPTSLGGVPGFLGDLGGRVVEGGRQLSSDVGTALFGNRAPAGSLADQAGLNQIPGATAGGIVSQFMSGLSNVLGGQAAPAAPMQASSTLTSQLPASSSVVAPAPAPAPAAPAPSPESTTASQGLKKGSANVKSKGKGKAASSPKGGLEAMLPALLAAMQGGGGGPPVGPPAGEPPAPGFKKGSANVKGKGSKGTSGDQPAGLEALLAALQQGGGAAGPQAAGPPMPMPMAPGGATLPGFALGIGDVQFVPPPVPPLMPTALPPSGRGYAQGTPSVQSMPNYPFGAGYLFGANEVPGQGTGKTDTVPAMLAPHEAVLNRAAADMLGRGLIAALNSRGVQQMGMHRGAPA